MFEALGQRLSSIFSGLRGKVSDSDLIEFTAQIKTALLESDVALEVAEGFSNKVLEKCKSQSDEINKSTNPAARIFEIVNTELTQILGGSARRLQFAIITPALISGAIADRTKFTAWAVFVTIWVTIVYFPVAHWVFAFGNKVGDTVTGAGFLAARGVQDFAGGTAVHINAGAAGLALAIVLGKRVGWRRESMRPHSMPLVLIGAGLLWFGWFGFNAGSALGANGVAALAMLNTQVATAAAALGWLFVEKIRDGHPTSLGVASGAVAGLVAITPACAFVAPWAAVVIGLFAGIFCALAVGLKYLFNIDDSLDVVGVHLVGGIWGCLSIGFFGSKAINNLGLDGIFYGGGTTLLGKQAFGAFFVLAYSFIVTLIIGFIIDKTIGFRVKPEAEVAGIDYDQHAETGYELTSSSRGGF